MVEFTCLTFEDIHCSRLKCELPISIKTENILSFYPVYKHEEYTRICLEYKISYIVNDSYEEVRRKLKMETKKKKKKMQFINED